MSAPDTNIEKQKRRHWAPLVGSALVVVFGIAMILWWALEQAAQAPGPETETETGAPAEATGEIGASTGGGAANTAPVTGGQGNVSGSQPGVEIDQGSGAGTPETIGSPPPAGVGQD